MLKPLTLILLAITFSGCQVVLKNLKVVTPKYPIEQGAIVGETVTKKVYEISVEEFLEFLLAKPPNKGAASCLSSEDYTEMKTELEQACRELGSKCSIETQDMLQSL